MGSKWKKIISFCIILVFALALQLRMAEAAWSPFGPGVKNDINTQTGFVAGPNFNPNTDETSLVEMVSYVVGAFLGLLATIFIILIIISGYNWMTAAGREEKVEKAQHTLRTAIIGLAVTAAAYAITWFVFARLPDNLERTY